MSVKVEQNLAKTPAQPLLVRPHEVYTLELLARLQDAAGGQSALAQALEISRAAIWKWWTHKEIPLQSLPDVIAWAKAHGVEIEPAKLRPDFFTDDVIAAL